MKMTVKVLVAFAVAIIGVAAPVVDSHAHSWTGDVTITTVYPTGGFSGLPGGTIIRIAAAHNPENCAFGTYFYLDRTMDGYQDLLSMFLAAHVAGRQVNILVEGCGTVTWAGPLIKAAQLPQ